MKPSEYVRWRQSRLNDGCYCASVRRAVGLMPLSEGGVTVRVSCRAAIDSLMSAVSNPALRRIIPIYTLGLVLSRFSGERRIGLMADCGSGYTPLVFEIDENEDIRSAVKTLYEDCRRSAAAGQPAYKALNRFLTARERECLEGRAHLYIACGPTPAGSECFELENGEASLSLTGAEADRPLCLSFLRSFVCVLPQVVREIGRNGWARNIEWTDAAERERLLKMGTGPERPLPAVVSFAAMVAEQAERRPERTAIRCGAEQVSYRLMMQMMRRMAGQLCGAGIRQNDRVVLECVFSIETIVTILAIWSLGAIYVPVLRDSGSDRILRVLQRAGARWLVRTDDLKPFPMLPDGCTAVTVGSAGCEAEETVEAPVSGANLHMIFTSGTTGEPKGVLIDTVGFYNLCCWYRDTYRFDDRSVSLLLTNFSFDASVKNIAVPLMTGGELVLVPTTLYDVERINAIIECCGVTHINCVPTLLEQMLNCDRENGWRQLQSLRAVILGGEKFRMQTIRNWQISDPRPRLISNVYGPTEATDLAAFRHLNPDDLGSDTLPIGRPLDNKRLYVMDAQRRLCPEGAVGMLCVAGIGVAVRYENDPSASSAFEPDPHTSGTLYVTGDLVRWNGAGELVYIGRSDHQIKLNGQRIELGEIEKTARRCAGVDECAAVLCGRPDGAGELTLVYTLHERTAVDEGILRGAFEANLPRSMHPNRTMRLDKLPKNESGKTDYSALRRLISAAARSADPSVGPRNEGERQVLEAWKAVLKRENISVITPFFEAGGNSLLLNTLKIELEKRLHVAIHLADLFEYPTVEQQAAQFGQEI